MTLKDILKMFVCKSKCTSTCNKKKAKVALDAFEDVVDAMIDAVNEVNQVISVDNVKPQIEGVPNVSPPSPP